MSSPRAAASAIPYAAATPIAGAPRTASVRIASASSPHSWQRRSTIASGSCRWSSTTTASSSSRTIRSGSRASRRRSATCDASPPRLNGRVPAARSDRRAAPRRRAAASRPRGSSCRRSPSRDERCPVDSGSNRPRRSRYAVSSPPTSPSSSEARPDCTSHDSSFSSWYCRLSAWPARTKSTLPTYCSACAQISSYPHGLSTRRGSNAYGDVMRATPDGRSRARPPVGAPSGCSRSARGRRGGMRGASLRRRAPGRSSSRGRPSRGTGPSPSAESA